MRAVRAALRRMLRWIRMLVDPLWIPPEEMEAARRDMQERADLGKQRRSEEE